MVTIGRILGTHGLKGFTKVRVLTDFDERFDPGREVWVDGIRRRIEASRQYAHGVQIKFEGIDTVEGAEALHGKELLIDDADVPALEEDEYLTRDLIGMRVFDADEEIGTVDHVLPLPAHDVLVVGEVLIPATKAFVHEVDLSARTIRVSLIEGMREKS